METRVKVGRYYLLEDGKVIYVADIVGNFCLDGEATIWRIDDLKIKKEFVGYTTPLWKTLNHH